MNRRSFLSAALGATTFSTLSAAHKGKIKITDVKCMIVRGTWDWNLIKIETDAGISGIGEAYWGPGVKDIVLRLLKQHIIGRSEEHTSELQSPQ